LTNNETVCIALLHFPVYNKEGAVVASSITNLDLHDLARLTVTYGLKRYYLLEPLELQAQLAQRLMSHWLTGPGADANWTRQAAFQRVKLIKDLNQARKEIERESGTAPKLVATTARKMKRQTGFAKLREKMAGQKGQEWIILFGTGWGLTEEFMESECDYILEPLLPGAFYNHLSVRSAASIIIDRLFAIDRKND
jgi:hypothetical protein